MASISDFNEGDWRETLTELRMLIVGAGFVEWDASMAIAMAEEEYDSAGARQKLIRYALSFFAFLRVRSEVNLSRMRGDLGELIKTENELPVNDAVIRDQEGERAISLLEGASSDGLMEEVWHFVIALVRESTDYFDDSEPEE